MITTIRIKHDKQREKAILRLEGGAWKSFGNIGFIDKPRMTEIAARISEGGHEAFDRRQHKWGFDHD